MKTCKDNLHFVASYTMTSTQVWCEICGLKAILNDPKDSEKGWKWPTPRKRRTMAYIKSPYKEINTSSTKIMGWNKKKKHGDACQCKVCEMLKAGQAPAVTGYKTGGKWG